MDMTHSRAVKDQAFVTRLLADLVRATPDDLDALLEQGIERLRTLCRLLGALPRLWQPVGVSKGGEWLSKLCPRTAAPPRLRSYFFTDTPTNEHSLQLDFMKNNTAQIISQTQN